MKCRKAYGIMPVGENDRSAHVAQQKAPEVATPGLFYSVLGGWLNPKAGYQLFLGRIYARIYPLDIGCLSCYNMCSGYIASSPVFISQIALSDVNISVVLLCSVIPYDFSIFFGKP